MKEKKEYKLTFIINGDESKKDYKKIFDSIREQKITKEGTLQVLMLQKQKNEEKSILKHRGEVEITFCKDKEELISTAKGQYVCFSNGIDRWGAGALDLVCGYLDNNKNVGCAIANEKYTNRIGKKLKIKDPISIIDINENAEQVQKDLRLMVFRKKYLKEVPRLEALQNREELIFALKIIEEAKEYAVIPNAILWCKGKNKILPDARMIFDNCRELSKEINGEITKYTNHFMMAIIYELIAIQEDKNILQSAIKNIPDEIIAKSIAVDTETGFAWEVKQYAYVLKHGKAAQQQLRLNDEGQMFFGEELAYEIKENSLLQMKLLEISPEKETIVFEGFDKTSFIDSKAELFVRDERGELYPIQTSKYKMGDFIGCDGEIAKEGKRFYVEIPLHYGMTLEFVMKYSYTQEYLPCKFSKGNFIKLHPQYKHSYYVRKPFLIQIEESTIFVKKNTPLKHVVKEATYMAELSIKGNGLMACYRMLYWINKLFASKKPIWLINDRPHNAGDNGEVLFKYLMQSDLVKKYEIYFVISKKSPDYNRLTKIGPVLDYYSHKHKIKFLLSDKIISSIGNELPTNPFGGSRKMYYDLYKADFVYLRHGVSHNDQSGWLNKFRRNYKLINSSSKREYESLINGNYLYSKDQVVLCGLPRFDNLVSENKNKILFLPTWRKSIQGEKIADSEKRQYSVGFVESEFFKFYSRLINDERLHQTMREHNFTGDFYLHPVMSAQIRDFKSNEYIQVHSEIADYQKAFRESNIMVTDYSSVAFDFAYLKKPVVYAQFDIEKFYEEHSWDKGYFSYEDDAFGHVTHDYETTLKAIIDYIENKCVMEKEFVDRVDKFFAYTDRNNCKRIVDAILDTERE